MSTRTPTQIGVRTGAVLLTVLLAAACVEDFALPPNEPTIGEGLRLEVQPLRSVGAPGDRVFLEARVVDARGQVQEGYEITWSQSAPGIAELSSRGGLATAYFRGIGVDTLYLEAGGLFTQAILTGVRCVEGSRNYPCL